MASKIKNPIERFWSKVDKSRECWNWIGTKLKNRGYGVFTLNYKNLSSHRYSYLIHYGEIPSGMYVCHSCDNPSCVRPEHLWLGTAGDNVRDCFKKGRGNPGGGINHLRGENIWNSKLTYEQVKTIRTEYVPGKNGGIKFLAHKYGVDYKTLWRVVNNITWKNEFSSKLVKT